MQDPHSPPQALYEKRVTQLIQIIRQLQEKQAAASTNQTHLRNQITEKQTLMGVLESKIAASQEEMSRYKREMEQASEENKWLNTKLATLGRIGSEKDTIIESQTQKQEKLRAQLQQSEKDKEETQNRVKQIQRELKQLRQEVELKTGEITSKNKILELTRSELEELRERLEKEKKDKQALQQELLDQKIAQEIFETKSQMEHYSEKRLLELSKNQLATENLHLKEENKRVSEECFQAQESYKEEKVLKKVVQEERSRIKRELEDLKTEFKKKERNLEEKCKESEEAVKGMSEEYEREIERAEAVERELERVKGDLQRYKLRDQQFTSRISKNRHQTRQDMNIVISNYQETKRELETVKSERDEMKNEMEKLMTERARYEPELRNMKSQLELTAEAYNGRLRRLRELERECDLQKKRKNEFEVGFMHFKSETGILRREIGHLREKLVNALAQNGANNNRRDHISDLVKENSQLKTEIESHQNELEEAKIQIDIKLKEVTAKYEAEVISLQTKLESQDQRFNLGSKLEKLSQTLKENKSMRKRDQIIEVLSHLPAIGEQLSLKREDQAHSKLGVRIGRLSELESQKKGLTESVQVYKEESQKQKRESESYKTQAWALKEELKSIEQRAAKSEIAAEQLNGKNTQLRAQIAEANKLIQEMRREGENQREKLKQIEVVVEKQNYEIEMMRIQSQNATRREMQLTNEKQRLLGQIEKLSQKTQLHAPFKATEAVIEQSSRTQEVEIEAQLREANLKSIISNLRLKVKRQSEALEAVQVLLRRLKEKQAEEQKKKAKNREREEDVLDALDKELRGFHDMGSAQLVGELSRQVEEKTKEVKKMEELLAKQQREFEELIEQHHLVLTQIEERELAARVEEDADLHELKHQLEQLEEADSKHQLEKRRIVEDLSRQNVELVANLKKSESRVKELEHSLYNKKEDLKAAQLWIDALEIKNQEVNQKHEKAEHEKDEMSGRLRELLTKAEELEELQASEGVKQIEIQGLKEMLELKDKIAHESREHSSAKLSQLEAEINNLSELNKVLQQTAEGVATQEKEAHLMSSFREKEESVNLRKRELQIELKTTRKRLQEKSEELCEARNKIMVLIEEKKMIQIEGSHASLRAERAQELQSELDQLTEEAQRLHHQNNFLYTKLKEEESERHELALKGRNLENQNLLLTKQVEYAQGQGGGSGKPENQAVNVQIRKLLGVINRARRLNQGHLRHQMVGQSLNQDSLLGQRKSSGLDEAEEEPSKEKKSNLT